VCSGQTGHAEIVEVEFDPEEISLQELLRLFWSMHDPTMDARNYKGGQYRSAIFYTSEAQKEAISQSLERERASGNYRRPILTDIQPAPKFWIAEDYHQQYYDKSKKSPAARLF
jgi:peptide-methionine (S)-S-oxide reductase